MKTLVKLLIMAVMFCSCHSTGDELQSQDVFNHPLCIFPRTSLIDKSFEGANRLFMLFETFFCHRYSLFCSGCKRSVSGESGDEIYAALLVKT